MIEARRLQRSFGDGFIAAEVKDLHEAWMPHVDAILADDEIIATVHQALGSAIPTVADAVGQASPPKWCYAYWF